MSAAVGQRGCFIRGRTRFCEVDGPHSSWAVGCVSVRRGSRRVPEPAAENVPSWERSLTPWPLEPPGTKPPGAVIWYCDYFFPQAVLGTVVCFFRWNKTNLRALTWSVSVGQVQRGRSGQRPEEDTGTCTTTSIRRSRSISKSHKYGSWYPRLAFAWCTVLSGHGLYQRIQFQNLYAAPDAA